MSLVLLLQGDILQKQIVVNPVLVEESVRYSVLKKQS